jgi:hypothetical protein
MRRARRDSGDRHGNRATRTLDRASLARLAAHERWARVRDRSAATAAARAVAGDRFFLEARRLHPGLPDDEILKHAQNLRSAHAIRAARARWGMSRPRGNASKPRSCHPKNAQRIARRCDGGRDRRGDDEGEHGQDANADGELPVRQMVEPRADV